MIDDDDDKKKQYGQKGKQQGQPGKQGQGQGRPATRFMDRPGSEHPENQPESPKPEQSTEGTPGEGLDEEAGQDYGQQGTAKHVQPKEKGKQNQGQKEGDEKTGA